MSGLSAFKMVVIVQNISQIITTTEDAPKHVDFDSL